MSKSKKTKNQRNCTSCLANQGGGKCLLGCATKYGSIGFKSDWQPREICPKPTNQKALNKELKRKGLEV